MYLVNIYFSFQNIIKSAYRRNRQMVNIFFSRFLFSRLMVWFCLIHCNAFSVALDINPGPGYDILLLRLIPRDLLSACPHRQFHTLPGLLESRAALPNSYPYALRAMQGGSLYHFYDGFWYDPAGRRTHELPCERRRHLMIDIYL